MNMTCRYLSGTQGGPTINRESSRYTLDPNPVEGIRALVVIDFDSSSELFGHSEIIAVPKSFTSQHQPARDAPPSRALPTADPDSMILPVLCTATKSRVGFWSDWSLDGDWMRPDCKSCSG